MSPAKHDGIARRNAARLLIAAAIAPLAPTAARAQDLRVFAAGAAKTLFAAVAPRFEREGGGKIDVVFDTVGALRDRVLAGEAPDLVLLSERSEPSPTG